ncbi:hypothetical protein COD81_07105 [Bacillus cereus]|uniref:tectonin domain-containing protein n=1 Tax=Bacillus cereus TaxID=1396 RepID=UPI000BF4B197|nr:tectonin domain-containing protein [Bacillus cereus]PFL73132.1 hypothetical protein COJ32_28720 [Bacillus cereus]PGV10515.1 hypothetical protein COD81_07105 [Bacillus cereus]
MNGFLRHPYEFGGETDWTKIWGPVRNVYMGRKLGINNIDTTIFATHPINGDIYKYNSPNNWTKIGGPGSMFSAGEDTLYGVSPDKSGVYQWMGTSVNPNQWIQIGGPADKIFANGNTVYATNPTTGDIYRYNGVPLSWTKIGGPGNTFATTANPNLIIGLSPDKSGVHQWTGTLDHPNQWKSIGGPAGSIYAGDTFYATNPTNGDIYRYNGVPLSWTKIGGPGSMFATSDSTLGVIYGLSPDKSGVYQWTGTSVNPNQWIQIGGPAGSIYAGGTNLCATDLRTGDLYCKFSFLRPHLH